MPQLTIGLEGEWYQNASYSNRKTYRDASGAVTGWTNYETGSQDNYNVDLVTVFRF